MATALLIFLIPHRIFEMTWAPDGRATFHYGAPVREGQVHVGWRRVGTHAVFANP